MEPDGSPFDSQSIRINQRSRRSRQDPRAARHSRPGFSHTRGVRHTRAERLIHALGGRDQHTPAPSFEELELSESDDPDEIAKAFDEALGDTMRDAVEWSVRQIHTHAARNPRPQIN